MKMCVPCGRWWMTWTAFGRHMLREHGVDRETFYRRANQVGDNPCYAVRSDKGRWSLMVQPPLML